MHIDVIGTPAPQGSKRHVGNGVMIESSAKVKPWRQDVKYAALERIAKEDAYTPMASAVDLMVTFRLARPKGHYRTGRNCGLLRDSAPKAPAGKPDIDKLLRSTLDALGEAGIWRDDSQVTTVAARKIYATAGHVPGASITVVPIANIFKVAS